MSALPPKAPRALVYVRPSFRSSSAAGSPVVPTNRHGRRPAPRWLDSF